MKAPIERVTVVLTARQARALHEHLKATVPNVERPPHLVGALGLTELEGAHSALVDALCRAASRAVLKGGKPS